MNVHIGTRSVTRSVGELIADYTAAVAEHDRLFKLFDDGEQVPERDVVAALGPINETLEAICRARPTAYSEIAKRRTFLTDNLYRVTENCPALIEAMYEALI